MNAGNNVMSLAWKIARTGANKFGGSPKEYFTESLKKAWGVVKQLADTPFSLSTEMFNLNKKLSRFKFDGSTTQWTPTPEKRRIYFNLKDSDASIFVELNTGVERPQLAYLQTDLIDAKLVGGINTTIMLFNTHSSVAKEFTR